MKKPLIQKLGLLGLVSFLSYTAAMLIALAACGKTETPEPTETPLPAPAIQTAAPETVKPSAEPAPSAKPAAPVSTQPSAPAAASDA